MSAAEMIVDGDVVDITHRRRNRNAVRDVAILPPTVDQKALALGTLDPESQVRAVSVMLTHAAMELAKAADAQSVMEWKAKAGAIQELTKQLKLGKELRLDAEEFVRRTERALGVAIRDGQSNGSIATPHEVSVQAAKIARGAFTSGQNAQLKPVDTDFALRSELSGNHSKGQFGIYGLTDDVSDGQFEEALAEARAEGNLSRANVARKAKAKAAQSKPESPEPQPTPTAQEPKRRLTKHDSTEMLTNIKGMLHGIVESLPFIDPTDIDPTENRAVITSIRQSLNKIRAVLKEIENV